MIKAVPFTPRKVIIQEGLVSLLEEVLKRAKTGEFSVLGVIGVMENEGVFSAYHLGDGSRWALLGAINNLSFRINNDAEKSGQDE